jgi:hypothetical protein
MLLRKQLYAGIVDVPEDGVRGKRGDFEPLISEDLFYHVQATVSGRVPSTTPRQRGHPDFPLRGFVRCKRMRQARDGVANGRIVQPSKWRFAKARPEPDFKYRSKRMARCSSANSMTTCNCQGRRPTVWGHRPLLWSASRALTSP